MEYASSLWDPAQITLIKKIERLQRKAVRFVSGNRSREEGVVSGLLAERNWLSLQSRRKTSRLCMVFRMVNNLVGLEVCDYFKFKSSATRSRHNLQFQRFSCGSEVARNSFFYRSIVDWNNLDSNIVNVPTLEMFRSRLNKSLGKVTNENVDRLEATPNI